MLAAVLLRTEFAHAPALAFYRDGRIRRVLLRFPLERLGKGEAAPKVYHDARGAYRWITVHPHGDDGAGIPVKIRESKTERGTWHVVGGAGGKLNYLRLTNVKSPEEYKEQAKEKAEARKEAAKAKAESRQERLAGLTDAEREVEISAERQRAERKEQLQEHREVQRQEFIANIAGALGWDEAQWKFDATRDRLRAAGASDERIETLERAHWRRVYSRARDAVQQAKRQLLLDAESRAQAGLTDLAFDSDNPAVVALGDLDPDKAPRGLGYRPEVTKRSDAEITRTLASEDVERLRRELDEARNIWNPAATGEASSSSLAAEGRYRRLAQELHVAELLRDHAETAPEELRARDGELVQHADAVRAEQAEYLPRLKELRATARAGDPDARAELDDLEERRRRDEGRLKNLSEQRDDVAVLLGSQEATVKAERGELGKRRQAEREAEIRAERGDAGVARYRAMRELMEAGAAQYRAEVAALKAAGALQQPDLPTAPPAKDPGLLAKLVRHDKAMQQFERETKHALEGDDADAVTKLFGKGYYVDTRRADLDAEIEAEAEAAVAHARTNAFLDVLEDRERDPSLADLTDDDRRQALSRHVSAGAYQALNQASLTVLQHRALHRDIADVLGAAGAAQLLARAIHRAQGAGVADTIAGLEEYHLHHQVETAEEAIGTATDLYERARELELGAAAHPGDLMVMQELNAKRREALQKAREVLGRTLGELESHAALILALKSKPANELHVTLGPISADTAIRQARAIGLGRDDYVLDTDGVNRFLTVRASGLDKLIEPVDPDEIRLHDEVMAIKQGDRDEHGWLPPGLVTRPASSFTDPGLRAPSLGQHQQQQKPFEQWGRAGQAGLFGGGAAAGDLRQDVLDHVGARIADGEDPNDILPNILANLRRVPAEHREAVVRALDEIMPTEVPLEENGTPVYRVDEKTGAVVKDAAGNPVQRMRRVKADFHQGRLNQLAEDYVRRAYGSDPTVAAFHAQGLRMSTPAEQRATIEAMHRAIAVDPRAVVAFKDLGDLTPQEQAALRHYHATQVAGLDPKTGVDQRKIDAEIAALGREPPQGTVGLFGEQANPEWAEWNQRRQAITARAVDASTAWNDYVGTHKSVHAAYEALQDRLKSDFIDRFQRSYGALHAEPLRLGKRTIRNAERHLAATSPEERERLLREQRKIQDELRSRAQGKYATGSVKERVDRALQMAEIERQNAIGLFGDAAPAGMPSAVGAGERFALGERAENQLKALMGTVAGSVRPGDQPVALRPDFSMSGDYVKQQRAVKMFLARKRMGAFLAVGSGKSAISLGAFTAAASDSSTGVKRGIWVVPSAVQGQFGGEMARFVEPGRFQWHAQPGATAEERFNAHRDPNTHMVVMTHQGFRDDMVRLVAEHRGINSDAAAKWFMGLSRKERAAAVHEAWQKAGIDYQASFLDEGHVTLDRRAKADSLLSAMMTAVSDNTPYYMAMTADPAKNDVSEIRSQLDKLYPDGRYGDEARWHQRYGLATSASREALRREVAGHFMASHVSPPVAARRAEHRVALHPEQQREYEQIMALYQKARGDHARGEVNVEAIKALAPSSFEGQPPERHEAIARRMISSLAIAKDAAIHRAINLAPPERNAKIQAVVERLKDHPVRDKPVVIFAHNPEAVGHLERALTAAGHRVTTLTGAHSSKEKDERRRAFAPERGAEPSANVMILSDAGATGLNLQRGQTLIQYDTPLTAMVHNQRNGRIHRLGQTQDVDLVDLVADVPYEEKARRRLDRKYDLKDIFGTDAAEAVDESDLGAFIARARRQRTQLEVSRATRLAA